MNNKKNGIKLYNAYFPLWALVLFPKMWLVVIPANFIIDSIVLIISMLILKIADKKKFYIKHIFIIYGFGMLSDIIGAGFMLMMTGVFHIGANGHEPYLTIPGLLISAGLIFLLNYFITFRKQDKAVKLKLALIYAIVTAPYTFVLPLPFIPPIWAY